MTAQAMTKNKADLPTELRARIRHTLHTRHARQGTLGAKVEDTIKNNGERLWRVMEKRPIATSVVVGGSGLAVAMALGGAEVTLAMLLGYAAYQVLREGLPPEQAAQEMFKQLETAR